MNRPSDRTESSHRELEQVARQLAEASLRDGLAAECADAARSVAAGAPVSARVVRSARPLWAVVGASLVALAAFWSGSQVAGVDWEALESAGAQVDAVEDLARAGRWEEVQPAVGAARDGVAAVPVSAVSTAWQDRLDALAAEATASLQAQQREADRLAWHRELEAAIPPMLFGEGHGVVDWLAADREISTLFERAGVGRSNRGPTEQQPAVVVVADDDLRFLLDAWARIRRSAGNHEGAEEVLRIAMRLDPHPQRDSLRAAWFAGDDDGLVGIAGSLVPQRTEVATLVCAARALRARGLKDRPLGSFQTPLGGVTLQLLLEEVCERHPDHPYAALELGRAFRIANQPWRAFRYLHAAHALRTDSLALRREYFTLLAGGRLLPAYVAERETRLALDVFPRDPWLRRLLARRDLERGLRSRVEDVVFFGSEVWDESAVRQGLSRLEGWLESGPRPDRWALQATALVALGRFDEAVAAAQRGLEGAQSAACATPVQARLWQELGTARARLGRDGAEAALRRAVELMPEDPRGVWLLADLIAVLGQTAEAESSLRACLERRPAHRLAGLLRKRLAEVLLQSGDLVGAQAMAEQVVDAQPRDATAHQVLAQVLQHRGDLNGARDALQRSLDLLPFVDGRLTGLGVEVLEDLVAVVVEHAGHAAAVGLLQGVCERSIEGAPVTGLRRPAPDPLLLFLLGRIHREAGELQPALDRWTDAAEAGLETPEIFVSLAEVYEERRERLTGLRWRERAVARWPDDPALVGGLATALLQVGRPAEAAGQADRCRVLLPDALWPRILLVRALLASREFAGAADLVAELLAETSRVEPGDDAGMESFDRWGFTFGLGSNLLNFQGEFAAAERFLELAVAVDPDVAEAWCNYAASIWRQGRPAEALPLMRRGHQLGQRLGGAWNYDSAGWIQEIEDEIAAQDAAPAAGRPAEGAGR